MTRRIMSVALTTGIVALVLFLIPLAVAVLTLFRNDAQSSVQREALRAAVLVDPTFSTSDLTELPDPGSGIVLSLYDSTGTLVLGTGPKTADPVVAAALRGSPSDGDVDGSLTSAIPISAVERVTGVVRASVPMSTVWQRVAGAWVVMLAAAIVALGVGIASARALARRITEPMKTLTTTSQALGSGDFTVRMAASGLTEIDQAGSALNDTAERLAGLVQRERRMASNASHQLRTPLTGLRAVLESSLADPAADYRAAMRTAIERADTLESTIDEIIQLSTESVRGVTIVPAPELDAADQRWRGALAEAGRPLRVDIAPELPSAIGVPLALTQIFDILIENALRHGSGAVVLRARNSFGALAFDVEDDGASIGETDNIFEHGLSTTGSSGLGLALAVQLADDHGAKLMLSQRSPKTRFTLLLPGGGTDR